MGDEPRHNYAYLYFAKLSFFFTAKEAYGKRKKIVTQVQVIRIIYILEGHVKRSIN